jgi:hypothetical protein
MDVLHGGKGWEENDGGGFRVVMGVVRRGYVGRGQHESLRIKVSVIYH